MSAPRIVHVGKFYPPFMGGIETHLETLCMQLRYRFDVQVIVSNDRREAQRDVRAGIPVTRLATPFSITSAPVSPSLAAAVNASGADLVHVHLPHPAAVLGLLASGYRGPLVVTYHSDVVRQRLMSALFHPLLHLLLRRASAILVTSPNYLATSPVLAAHRSRCRVIPYGISLERFGAPRDPRVPALRVRFGPRLVLAVGRLVYYKGFDVLLQAMAAVDGRLVLIGDGPLRGALEARVAESGLRDKVVFLGELQNEDAAPYFEAADVFVLPSIARSEAFGIVQLEAMASGTPVVNTRLDSGVPWVSQDGQTGLTVPVGDCDALAAAINRVLSDEALGARLGAGGRARVQEEFGDVRMGDRIAAVYQDVLAACGAPAEALS
jgi:rhamnosyl/mannosyltransferase